jgi:hypothetical protein
VREENAVTSPEPAAVTLPRHPLHALTTYELRDYQRDLERAINRIATDAPVQADLRRKLDMVLAEQEDRARLAAGG